MTNISLGSREERIEKMIHCGLIGENLKVLFDDPLWGKMRALLIGGAVRDAIEGRVPRDFDIMIVRGDETILNRILYRNDIACRRNAFRGYKIQLNSTTIDIWFMKDHYVFRDHLYANRRENIEKSTFLNYDSLIYDLRKKTLYSKYYDDCIENGTLDIIGKKSIVKNNPNPILTLIKLVVIKRNRGYKLSPKVNEFINDQYNRFGEGLWNQILIEYERHYNTSLDYQLLSDFKKLIRDAVSECFEMRRGGGGIPGQYNFYDYPDLFVV